MRDASLGSSAQNSLGWPTDDGCHNRKKQDSDGPHVQAEDVQRKEWKKVVSDGVAHSAATKGFDDAMHAARDKHTKALRSSHGYAA